MHFITKRKPNSIVGTSGLMSVLIKQVLLSSHEDSGIKSEASQGFVGFSGILFPTFRFMQVRHEKGVHDAKHVARFENCDLG